jgi:hypothetical protein
VEAFLGLGKHWASWVGNKRQTAQANIASHSSWWLEAEAGSMLRFS